LDLDGIPNPASHQKPAWNQEREGGVLRLATRSWGEEGRPLAVLVHGVSASSRTWWRVGPWFAEKGWHAVGVDLRGHGDSPRAKYGLTLEDLTEDLYETASGLLGPAERIDVLLGHSLGALTALKLCEEHGDFVKRLVLEEPPGSESSGFDEVANMVESDVARAIEAPEEMKREQQEENPSWTEEDAANNAASLRDCDAGPIADMMRNYLRYDLTTLVGTVEIPTLLVLGSEAQGSALPEPERTAVENVLRRGTVNVFDAGHGVHREDFEDYIRLLSDWLQEPRQ
jgi:pimeloyl-ACP methyl ester carboxylesterase